MQVGPLVEKQLNTLSLSILAGIMEWGEAFLLGGKHAYVVTVALI